MHLTKVHRLQHRNYLKYLNNLSNCYIYRSLSIYTHTRVTMYKEDMMLTAVHRVSVHF